MTTKSAKNLVLTVFFALILAPAAFAQQYYMYVAAESDDEVSLVKFDADRKSGEIVSTVEVGVFPAETEGPHGITVSPDGNYWFVSIAHGMPFGQVWKYETGTNELVGKVEVGMFPASMEISSSTGLLYLVNFNLHGDMEPSTVTVIEPNSMTRLVDIPVGIMPHGSRISSDGKKQYHVSMMTDELLEIDTRDMEVSRRINLKKGEKKMMAEHGEKHAGMDHTEGMNHPKPVVKPTWADPHPFEPYVYVAGNGSDEIIEIDTGSWEITRRFYAGKGNAPYNLEVSADGNLLVASYKSGAKTGIWNLNTGEEVAEIPNSRKVSHGVAISPDNRYAFISVEGIGGEPGSVDVVDLESHEVVAVIETGKQAGGIYFWEMNN